jgi:exonuclease VII small subunit
MISQAFKELARGERAAAAMENHLNSLEKKIEELLAKAEEEERMMKRDPQSKQAADKPTTHGQGKDAL